MAAMSRWFVGSSSSSRFAGESIMQHRATRAFSPPESVESGSSTWSE